VHLGDALAVDADVDDLAFDFDSSDQHAHGATLR
jgi:hypothetical protein